ncbi:MAG TPA: outer membrane lipoprotein carrier protein LolA [Longimicrobiales bacterium]|nr:outer membrane lipoprotein carrier protein LolA [Longimicrobiales bacterium]
MSHLTRSPLRRRARAAGLHALMCALVVLSLPAAARGQDRAAQALETASRRYQEFSTLCADFKQVLTVTLLGDRRESRGELCQRRPNLFFMRFSDPEGDAVVADGSHFWIYYPSMNPGQVLKLPLDPSRGGLDFYREFLDRPDEKYDATLEGEEVVTGRNTVRIALRPREPRGYRTARVWIDPAQGMIRQVEINEDNGTIRLLTLDAIRVDPPLAEGAFTFPVPEGVRVISR